MTRALALTTLLLFAISTGTALPAERDENGNRIEDDASPPSIDALRTLPPPAVNGTKQMTRGYYAAGDGGGDMFVWNGTLTTPDNGGAIIAPQASSRAGRWVSAGAPQIVLLKKWGVKADGVSDDAARVGAAMTWLAGQDSPRTMILPEGTLKILSAPSPSTFGATYLYPTHAAHQGTTSVWNFEAFNGDLTIKGAGPERTIIDLPDRRTLWDGVRGVHRGLALSIEGLTMKYTGGGIGGQTSEYAVGIKAEFAHLKSLTVKDCDFHDFTVAICAPNWNSSLTNPTYFTAERCRFYYRHGAASTGQAYNDHTPRTALRSEATYVRIAHCYFDGLVDPTFAGVNPAIPAHERMPIDNFIEHAATGEEVEICENVVVNHGIEGIHVFGIPSATARLRVINNYVSGAPRFYPYFYGTRQGIVASWPNSLIQGNSIANESIGIVMMAGNSKTVITGNRVTESYGGYNLSTGCDGVVLRGNSYYARTAIPAEDLAAGWPANRFGVYTGSESQNNLIEDNILDAGTAPWWTASASVAPQSGGTINTPLRVYLTSVTGFEAGRVIYLKKAAEDGVWRRAPVIAVGENYVDLQQDWGPGFESVTAAQEGDKILQTGDASPWGGDMMLHAAVFIRGGTGGSGNIVKSNLIRNYDNGIDRFRFSPGNSDSDLQVTTNNTFVATNQKYGSVRWIGSDHIERENPFTVHNSNTNVNSRLTLNAPFTTLLQTDGADAAGYRPRSDVKISLRQCNEQPEGQSAILPQLQSTP